MLEAYLVVGKIEARLKILRRNLKVRTHTILRADVGWGRQYIGLELFYDQYGLRFEFRLPFLHIENCTQVSTTVKDGQSTVRPKVVADVLWWKFGRIK